MTNKEQLIEQHIREYESRLKHIDELYQRAHDAAQKLDETHGAHSELKNMRAQHSQLKQEAEEIRTMPLENWREETVQSSGPMAIWDILAQKLEDFVERHE
jgi:3'-phosphoadenosine 5'-phosphosulfate sulfotransferase (PAPS reductase)/FAD synthetase